jgi:hypothetical protein
LAALKPTTGATVALLLALCSMTLLASCGKDRRPRLVTVQGQLFLENKPAHKAMVWLHSVEPVPPGTPRPRGIVDEEGSFVVGTYDTRDGAPAGKYRIAIYWKAPGKSGDEEGESVIPYRYMDPATSGLPVIEVESDPVTLPAFHLTGND